MFFFLYSVFRGKFYAIKRENMLEIEVRGDDRFPEKLKEVIKINRSTHGER